MLPRKFTASHQSIHGGTKGDVPCPNEDKASSPEICSKGEEPHGPLKVESSVKSFQYRFRRLDGFIKQDGTSDSSS